MTKKTVAYRERARRAAALACATAALTILATSCDDGVVEPPTPAPGQSLAAAPVHAGDRDALVALYNATGGPDWHADDNWLTDQPLDDWHGVVADSAGRVTGLLLRDNGLVGSLPAELGALTELRFLQTPQNGLVGAIPPELGSLGRLGALWLSDNDLSGPLPPELAELDSLKGLWVGNNELAGVVPSGFRALEPLFFDVSGNQDLCVPATAEFAEWADGLLYFAGTWCDEADREALRVLYDATGGENWTSSEGWFEAGDLSGWHGVETDSAGRATGLDLSANGLSGELPPELGRLANLAGLDVSGNGLEGTLPGELGDLAKLATLDVSGNSLAGELPEALGDLANLATLDLSSNLFLGPLPLSLANTAIEDLRYENTRLCVPDDGAFRSWLGSIARHEGTGEVCAPLTEREVLEALYEATGGENWYESDNWLTDAPLGEWYGVETDVDGNVVWLELVGNLLVGRIPPELGQLAHLRWLNLASNYHLVGPLPPELFDLPELRGLALAGSNIGGLPPEIGRLAKLGELLMQGARLGGPLPPELGDLSEMRMLDLSGNNLVGEIPAELGNLSKLYELWLNGNGLTGPIPSELGNLPSLDVLNLSWNQLTGAIPAELGDMGSLRLLYLHENQLTGAIPEELGNLRGLENMWLSGNDLGGPIPASFKDLESVSSLYLFDNALEGPLPDSLEGMTNLEQLWVGRNAGLSGPVPVGMSSLPNLQSLKAGGTDLCAPEDPDFLEWLSGVPFHRLGRCDMAAAYLTQSVQSREFPVPLVPGRSALLRVFIASEHADGETLPAVRATFHLNDADIHVAEIAAGTGRIPKEVDEGDLAGSANADIPGWVVRPGLEMVIDVDPDGDLDPSLGIPRRIPAEGRLALDVPPLADLQLTLVPFLYEADPDSSILATTAGMAEDPDGHPMLAETRTLLPVGGWDIELHDPVVSSTDDGFAILLETEAIRLMEAESPRYWLSMLAPVVEYGLLGVALDIPSWSSFSLPLPATVAHELGHSMGLWHAPCGGAGGPDPLYPHERGTIGAWGYDRERERLVTPYAPDLMSYCGGGWISDYHRANGFRHRMRTEATATFGPRTRSVLVWGGLDADGDPFLEPSFIVDALPSAPPSGSDFLVRGRTDDGSEAFSIRFDMPELPDAPGESAGFVFAVPATWTGELESIALIGGDGSVHLDEDTDRPMTILRDPVTGQVRAILRRPAEQATAAVGEPGWEAIFSRGIPR